MGWDLTDEKYRLLALWAADYAEHVLHLFYKKLFKREKGVFFKKRSM